MSQVYFFFQAEDGIRDHCVTGVQTCAIPISKWSGAAFIDETTAAIREKVGNKCAICALSGGVDSTVAAVLVHRAVGNRLTNIFVNTGLLRRNEFENTLEMLRDRLKLHVLGVDASERFLAQLKGVSDPEIGRAHV